MRSLLKGSAGRASLQLAYVYGAAVDNAPRCPQLLGQRFTLPTYPQALLLVSVCWTFLSQARK
jgi:hypothetical protein